MNDVTLYRNIAFAGAGEVKQSSTLVRTAQDLAVEASLAALSDAGLTPPDVDGVITALVAARRYVPPQSTHALCDRGH